MAIKKETHSVVNCANCKIPLASYCARTKLSNEIYTLPNSLRETVLYELFSQIFKLRQTVINSLSFQVKHLELCRYCTRNLLNLLKYYSKILKVSNETESLFSRLIVQSKGRPGRPPKKSAEISQFSQQQRLSSFDAPTKPKSEIDIDIDIDVDSDLLDDASLGLQYLGLIRKKRVLNVDLEASIENDGSVVTLDNTGASCQKRSTRIRDTSIPSNQDCNEIANDGSLNLAEMDLLLPDYNTSELATSENAIVNSGIVCIDETLREPIFSSPEKIHILQKVIEGTEKINPTEIEIGNDPIPVPIPCRFCEKAFRHPQRLINHIKIHHGEDIESISTMELEEEHEGVQQKRQKQSRGSSVKTKFISMKNKRGRPPKYPLLGKVSQPSKRNSNTTPSGGKLKKKKIVTVSAKPGTGKGTGVGSENNPTVEGKQQGKGKTERSKFSKSQNLREELICKICKKKFKQIQLLNQHMRVHSNDKRCTECDKKFKSAALLKRHMQVHSQDKNNSAFKCDDCDREFPNLLGLQVHAVAHTRTLYTCKGCKRKFKIEKNFIQHQETARCTEKKHACPTCGKLFKNKDKVKRHLISMHSETKPFGCELCGKGFRSLADLKFHEVNAHICGETKQYQCDQCGKRFKSIETLKSHEMYSHKMEKKHFCSICGKGFPLLATLKIHEISHSTDRPYMCTYCGRTYKHANDLKSHEVVHYKDEEKPFVCPICGNRYHRKDVLRLHQGREKHFGPDVPIPPVTKKPSATKSKSRGTGTGGVTGVGTSCSISQTKMLKLENFEAFDKPDQLFQDESADSNVSNTHTRLGSTDSESGQGPNGISVIQNLNVHPQLTGNSSHEFIQTQLANSVMQLQQPLPHVRTNTVTVTENQHLIPIVQHSSISSLNSNQQSLGTITQPSFSIPMTQANEAISDFYRIMYDLT